LVKIGHIWIAPRLIKYDDNYDDYDDYDDDDDNNNNNNNLS
jgi:hypothetical protein